MAPSDYEAVERRGEGVRVEASKGPFSQILVEGEGNGGGCGVPGGCQGGKPLEEGWEREEPDDVGGYEGGPRPA